MAVASHIDSGPTCHNLNLAKITSMKVWTNTISSRGSGAHCNKTSARLASGSSFLSWTVRKRVVTRLTVGVVLFLLFVVLVPFLQFSFSLHLSVHVLRQRLQNRRGEGKYFIWSGLGQALFDVDNFRLIILSLVSVDLSPRRIFAVPTSNRFGMAPTSCCRRFSNVFNSTAVCSICS